MPRRTRTVAAGCAAAAILGLMACAEHENEGGDGEEFTTPTAFQTPLPTASPTPTPAPEPSAVPTPAPSPSAAPTSVAYVQDIKPILDADCARCHSGLSTYSGVMRYVQPGNAGSLLVVVTQPGGAMYPNLRGDAAGKSALIRRWVVENGALETR